MDIIRTKTAKRKLNVEVEETQMYVKRHLEDRQMLLLQNWQKENQDSVNMTSSSWSVQRQVVLNISTSKLQEIANSSRYEPSLRRSLLILNTLRNIERELCLDGLSMDISMHVAQNKITEMSSSQFTRQCTLDRLPDMSTFILPLSSSCPVPLSVCLTGNVCDNMFQGSSSSSLTDLLPARPLVQSSVVSLMEYNSNGSIPHNPPMSSFFNSSSFSVSDIVDSLSGLHTTPGVECNDVIEVTSCSSMLYELFPIQSQCEKCIVSTTADLASCQSNAEMNTVTLLPRTSDIDQKIDGSLCFSSNWLCPNAYSPICSSSCQPWFSISLESLNDIDIGEYNDVASFLSLPGFESSTQEYMTTSTTTVSPSTSCTNMDQDSFSRTVSFSADTAFSHPIMSVDDIVHSLQEPSLSETLLGVSVAGSITSGSVINTQCSTYCRTDSALDDIDSIMQLLVGIH